MLEESPKRRRTVESILFYRHLLRHLFIYTEVVVDRLYAAAHNATVRSAIIAMTSLLSRCQSNEDIFCFTVDCVLHCVIQFHVHDRIRNILKIGWAAMFGFRRVQSPCACRLDGLAPAHTIININKLHVKINFLCCFAIEFFD